VGTIIANKNVVKKVAPKKGKTIQIGNARLTSKVMGVDIACGTSLYEMDLAVANWTRAFMRRPLSRSQRGTRGSQR
jgi:hypothetical protein